MPATSNARSGRYLLNILQLKKGGEKIKLKPIADFMANRLSEKFGVKPTYELEAITNWLPTYPRKVIFESCWSIVSDIYSHLIDHNWTLDERLTQYEDQLSSSGQKIDIYFHEPYNFIFEFDEKQHFNQFRHITLNHCYIYNDLLSNYPDYLSWNENVTKKPGKSGFQKLKGFDPLFPPLLKGDKQDNRIRQRAFRDFLKDIIPRCIIHLNPTVRVSYHVTDKVVRDFTGDDLEKIGEHLDRICLWDRINL